MSNRGLKKYNFFKHIQEDLVESTTAGTIISLIGTVVMITLFIFELNDYFQLSSKTTLVVDELLDDVLRAEPPSATAETS
jgi:hypothetical protein